MGGKGVGVWDIEVGTSDGQVGDCHDADNRELDELHLNNA